MKPPALAELVLGGLIADPATEHAVLGDLAEEWSLRTSTDGRPNADLWYWRQTVRSTPYLFLEWWRSARGGQGDVGWGRAVAAGYVAMAVLTMPAELLADSLSRTYHAPASALLALAVGLGSGIVAGGIGRKAPVATGFAFAASYLGLWLVLMVPLGAAHQPPAYWASLLAIVPGALAAHAIAARSGRQNILPT